VFDQNVAAMRTRFEQARANGQGRGEGRRGGHRAKADSAKKGV